MAPYIPESKLLEIKAAAPIAEVIGQYVNLKPRGSYLVGLCPFHAETNPSFTVYPEREIFHCFGCGVGGNVFTFLMQHLRLTFPEAAMELARRYGVPLYAKELRPEDARQARKRQAFYEVNELAAAFFEANLRAPQGAPAQAYLSRRGLNPEVVASYRLGFVPDEWRALEKHLSARGGSLEAARDLGLIIPRQSRGYYDRFRGRLMFPIQDQQGRVIAFGGRVLGEGEPKYLNSPESPLYSKGRSLYGLYQAREALRKHQVAILVEGYMDLLALRVHGIEPVVATLGTALTQDQVRLLKGYVPRLVLVFDGDEAGLKAMMRSFPQFARERLPVRVLTLPKGEDPDSYAFNHGVEIFRHPWDQARPLFEVILEEILHSQGGQIEGKVTALERLKPYFQALNDPVERTLWTRRAAERLGVEETILQQALKSGPRQSVNLLAIRGEFFVSLEERLIKLILNHPTILPQVGLETWLEDFEDENLKEIAAQILICYQQHGRLDYGLLVNQMETTSLQNQVCALSLAVEEFPVENLATLVEDCCRGFRKRQLKKEQQQLKQQLHRAYNNQTGEEFMAIQARIRDVDLQLQNLQAEPRPSGEKEKPHEQGNRY
ncbi:MAG: DNA primase [Deltaproteobacteria bacterium]|nr:DNA primase [Deltaproteobacteria bacterium]MBW1986774.1 DNA primase [Deltaproteobacteria bacterium]